MSLRIFYHPCYPPDAARASPLPLAKYQALFERLASSTIRWHRPPLPAVSR